MGRSWQRQFSVVSELGGVVSETTDGKHEIGKRHQLLSTPSENWQLTLTTTWQLPFTALVGGCFLVLPRGNKFPLERNRVGLTATGGPE
jgi:hypothetical protein